MQFNRVTDNGEICKYMGLIISFLLCEEWFAAQWSVLLSVVVSDRANWCKIHACGRAFCVVSLHHHIRVGPNDSFLNVIIYMFCCFSLTVNWVSVGCGQNETFEDVVWRFSAFSEVCIFNIAPLKKMRNDIYVTHYLNIYKFSRIEWSRGGELQAGWERWKVFRGGLVQTLFAGVCWQ